MLHWDEECRACPCSCRAKMWLSKAAAWRAAATWVCRASAVLAVHKDDKEG